MSGSNETAVGPENVVFLEIKDYLSSSSSSSGQPTTSSSVQPQDSPQLGKIKIVQPHEESPSSSKGKEVVSEKRTDDIQRNLTSTPYKPKIISIGPLHNREPTEKVFKRHYVNRLLNRRGEDLIYKDSVDDQNDELLSTFIAVAISMLEEIKRYYVLPKGITSDVCFVKMLVIDGCFLLEFLFSWTKSFDYMIKNLEGEGVLLHDMLHMGNMINHDILLFQNQFPFSVLQKFYKILWEYGNYSTGHSMVKLAYDYHYKTAKWEKSIMTFLGPYYDKSILKSQPSNLLHLYHTMLFSENHPRPPVFSWSFIDLITRFVRKWIMAFFSLLFLIVSSPLYLIHKILFANITYPRNLTSATEIEEAGVRLQGSRMDLRFEKGTLLIPVLTLNEQSLCLLQNLLFFEFDNKDCPKPVNPFVHKYVSFLSLLIKNPGDLKVMEKHNIIITSDGGDESFALVNKLIQAGFKELMSGKANDIQSALKRYCKKPRHRWRAKLMKDYFGNPWSILGVLVGVILLGLTIIQTLFTVKSYYHQ